MLYRYDRYSISGGVLLYIRDEIPTKLFRTDIENLSVELILKKESGFSMALQPT